MTTDRRTLLKYAPRWGVITSGADSKARWRASRTIPTSYDYKKKLFQTNAERLFNL